MTAPSRARFIPSMCMAVFQRTACMFAATACSGAMAVAAPADDASGKSTPLAVERIDCAGNVSTSCDFIRGYLYLSVGDWVNETEIENARLRLQALRNFRSVDISL